MKIELYGFTSANGSDPGFMQYSYINLLTEDSLILILYKFTNSPTIVSTQRAIKCLTVSRLS